MSKHSALRSCRRPRDERRSGRAARGTGEHRPRGVIGRGAEVDEAAVGLHDRGLGQPGLGGAVGEPRR